MIQPARPARAFVDALESRRLLATVPSGFVDAAYGASVASGTTMAFAPDGRLFVTTQGGTLRIIKNGTLLATPFLTVSVDSAGERGLLGVTFDPNFSTNGYVYIYHTVAGTTAHNRVSRVTADPTNPDVALAGSITPLVDLDNLSTATNHNGGAINFGPDGKLYVAVGENANRANAQSLSNRLGKMLRYNSDGTIPTDNPTTISGLGATSGANRAIWAAGLRNPYTFTFDPNGTMLINDVGENTWEEIDVGGAGRNYGWGTTEGDFSQASFPNFTRPLYSYVHQGGTQGGFAITGGAYYRSTATTQFPAQYQNRYFFGDYVNNWIGYIDPANSPAPNSNLHTNFATAANGIVDLDVGPDGAVYYLQRGTTAGVRRVAPNASLAPSLTAQPANQSTVVGVPVTFSATATGQATLGYQWQRNGVDVPGATAASYTLASPTLADSGATFRVAVSNAVGITYSNAATLAVAAPTSAGGTFRRVYTDGGQIPPTQALTFDFTGPVSAPASALLLENLTTGQTISAATLAVSVVGNQIRFTFPGVSPNGVLPDGNYRATISAALTTDAAGNPVGGADTTVTFRFLTADADDDGTVGFSDLLILAQHYGNTGETFATGNFNYSADGTVDFDDLLLLSQRYGTTMFETGTAGALAPIATKRNRRQTPDVLQ